MSPGSPKSSSRSCRYDRFVTSIKDIQRNARYGLCFEYALTGNAMRILGSASFAILCATISAPIQADDFVSTVERNFPYEEVDLTYGTRKIEEGRCQEGTPFAIIQDDTDTSTKMDVAEQIHTILRSLGANAFVITELKEDTEVRSITVTPLTCAER